MSILKNCFRLLVYCGFLYAIYLLILLSLPYIHFKPGVDFLKTKQLVYHKFWWRWSFYVHVFSSPLVLLSGLLQFNTYFIFKFPSWHRNAGKLYLFCVLFLAAPSAFLMGLEANGGILAQLSFIVLSFLWFLYTILAYTSIRKRQVEKHGNFMLRSFSLALSAVSLRFYLYLFYSFKTNIPPIELYVLASWLSWIPNLLIAELFIYFGFIRKRLKFKA